MDAAMSRPAAPQVRHPSDEQTGGGQARDPRSAIAPMRGLALTAAHGTARMLCRAIADAAALGLLAPPCDPRADEEQR